ncbi:substrate-binding protein (plasmid) [Rhodococcus aetherivorans]|uniref:Substrate-binding protein n=1 Tax=Rhodococcus aetherivorans TaxID=191292 RepID=A0AA46NZ87_9NOCA|nr:substrate-binding protein [Rhodococcus aetherivorans]UYF97298.1 substrate-binding protein [Rhodococcus aetherivorans]
MTQLVLHAEEWTASPPSVAYSLFGAGDEAGWLFGAVCDRVEPGAAVRMAVHLSGSGAEPVEILGRIAAARPHAYLDIVHDQPWRGRIKLRFEAANGGTRVRLIAELDQPGLEWLMRRRGFPTSRNASSHPRLGLLTSKSGPGSLFATSIDNAAMLALEEINAEGGIHGSPVELIVGDDATDPQTGVMEARRLVQAGCRTILVAATSATYTAVAEALSDAPVLLVQPVMNEGGRGDRLRLQLGERPGDQLAAAVKPLMRMEGVRRWFLAGDDYCWPRTTHGLARQLLPRYCARVVGEKFASLGTRDFAPIIESIQKSGADIVLSTFVGADAVAFERQCYAMGLRDQCITLAPALEESTLTYIGDEAARGLYSVSGYFQGLQTEGNASLLKRYRAQFGPWAPPLSTLSESVFEAVHIWWQAARKAEDSERIAAAMRHGEFQLPRGTVTLSEDRLRQQLHLTKATGTELYPALG